MAQEIGDELSIFLRERGPIGHAFDRFERTTKVKREYVVYGLGSFFMFMFTMDLMSAFLTHTITTVWGFLGSIRALEKGEPVSMQKWTSYWVIYAIFNVFLGRIIDLMGHYFRKIYFLKFLVLCWCASPTENNGSDYLYQALLAHRFFRPLLLSMSSPKKAHAQPEERAGDVGKTVPMRSEKSRNAERRSNPVV